MHWNAGAIGMLQVETDGFWRRCIGNGFYLKLNRDLVELLRELANFSKAHVWSRACAFMILAQGMPTVPSNASV